MSSAEFEPLSPVDPVDDDVPRGVGAAIMAAHQGKYSLGETYWLWLVIPMAVWRGAMKLFDMTSLGLMLDDKYLFYALFGFLQLGSLAWTYFFGVGVFRSAMRAVSAFWATVACILVGISFFVSPLIAFMNVMALSGAGSPLVSPQEEADTLNLQLPRRDASGTTMLHVDYADGKMVFIYRIETPNAENLDWDNADRRLAAVECSGHEARFQSGILKSLVFRYTKPTGEIVHETVLDGKICSPEARAKASPPLTGEKLLEEQFSLLNKKLPKRLDRVTTLNHIDYANGVLQYLYQVDANALNVAVLQKNLHGQACAQFKTEFVAGQFSAVEYRYQLTNGSMPTVTVRKADCS